MSQSFHRGRRLRWTPEIRSMVRETPPLLAEDLIMPYFVVETEDQSFRKEIGAMPGQYQLSLTELEKQVEKAVDDGLKSVILFGIPAVKDEKASGPMLKTASYRKPCAASSIAGPRSTSSPTCACANT